VTRPPVVAIDGPAASGKGTLARRIAAELGFDHLDSGALYRAVALTVLRAGASPDDRTAAVGAALALDPARAAALQADPEIRSDATGSAASVVSAVPAVRAALFDAQRSFAAHPPGGRGAVIDGRDIGTVICADAPAKLFVTADTEIRARRRLGELQGRGVAAIFDSVLADMKERDRRDSQRATAPMVAAPDAFVLDTSRMTADEAFAAAMSHVRRALGLRSGFPGGA
jgi:cytidylate kinase